MFERNFEDPLNRLILEYFNTTDIAEWFRNKKIASKKRKKGLFSSIIIRDARQASKVVYDVFTINYVLGRLKQNKLRGVRIEAKGRLTRRRTASRSVFNMIYKGGLKNPLSSFKGLPAIMLRGDQKSNIGYSNVNSNGRNGAFGVKGWIASRTSKV